MERAKGQVLYEHPDGLKEYLTDFLLSEISDEAKEALEEHGEKAADFFYNTATGQGTPPIRTLIDRWLDEQDVTLQRKQHHRAVVGRFLRGRATLTSRSAR
jgi:predicted amidohydrolase YtcJ